MSEFDPDAPILWLYFWPDNGQGEPMWSHSAALDGKYSLFAAKNSGATVFPLSAWDLKELDMAWTMKREEGVTV